MAGIGAGAGAFDRQQFEEQKRRNLAQERLQTIAQHNQRLAGNADRALRADGMRNAEEMERQRRATAQDNFNREFDRGETRYQDTQNRQTFLDSRDETRYQDTQSRQRRADMFNEIAATQQFEQNQQRFKQNELQYNEMLAKAEELKNQRMEVENMQKSGLGMLFRATMDSPDGIANPDVVKQIAQMLGDPTLIGAAADPNTGDIVITRLPKDPQGNIIADQMEDGSYVPKQDPNTGQLLINMSPAVRRNVDMLWEHTFGGSGGGGSGGGGRGGRGGQQQQVFSPDMEMADFDVEAAKEAYKEALKGSGDIVGTREAVRTALANRAKLRSGSSGLGGDGVPTSPQNEAQVKQQRELVAKRTGVSAERQEALLKEAVRLVTSDTQDGVDPEQRLIQIYNKLMTNEIQKGAPIDGGASPNARPSTSARPFERPGGDTYSFHMMTR